MVASTEVPQATRKSLPVLVDEALSEVGTLLAATKNEKAVASLNKASLALSCCKAHFAEETETLRAIEDAQARYAGAWDALRAVTDAPAGETGVELVARAVEVIRGLTEWIASESREAA